MPSEISPNASVTLDGNGNGQVSLTPPAGTIWRLRLANVSTTSTVNSPQAFLYRGSSSGPVEQIDSTFLGNSASSGMVAGAPFFQGQVLWAKWTGGDPGAQAVLQAYGQQQARGEASPFDDTGTLTGFPLSVANVFRAGNTVITAAGEFIYDPAPGPGNLVASAAKAPGTEQYGNNYLAGQASYSGGSATSMAAGIISFYTGSLAGGWALAATQQFFSGLIFMSTGLETQNNVLDDGLGNCSVLGTMTIQGVSASIGNGATANLFLSPPMATPPNAAAVAAGTATLAQLNAFCNGLYTSMKNRGMFN
jgi:hypothetical protein